MNLVPLEIKTQGRTDFCLGCVISSVAEQYTNEPCEESYSFSAGKLESGQSLVTPGIPPKAALLGAIRYGVLPKKDSPYGIATQERDFLANWDNWKNLESSSLKPFKSFYRVRLKNIDKALERTTLVAGVYWQSSWDESPYINTDKKDEWNKMAPHEVRIIGKKDNYLIIQNSKGKDVGDNGLWYLPKEAYNMINHVYELSPKPWPNKLVELISKFL